MEGRKDRKGVESKEGCRMDEWRTKGGKKKEKKKEKRKKRETKKGRNIERKKTEENVIEIVMSERQTE